MGKQMRAEDYSHLFINLLKYEAGTFFIASQPDGILLVQGRILPYPKSFLPYKYFIQGGKASRLIFLEIYSNCKIRSWFAYSNILSLKEQPTRTAWKKIIPKFPNILRRIYSTILFISNIFNNIIQKHNVVGCFSHK